MLSYAQLLLTRHFVLTVNKCQNDFPRGGFNGVSQVVNGVSQVVNLIGKVDFNPKRLAYQ
jgi:hypothetical protein